MHQMVVHLPELILHHSIFLLLLHSSQDAIILTVFTNQNVLYELHFQYLNKNNRINKIYRWQITISFHPTLKYIKPVIKYHVTPQTRFSLRKINLTQIAFISRTGSIKHHQNPQSLLSRSIKIIRSINLLSQSILPSITHPIHFKNYQSDYNQYKQKLIIQIIAQSIQFKLKYSQKSTTIYSSISLNHTKPPTDFTTKFDPESFIYQNKNSSSITITKNMLVSNYSSKIALTCSQVIFVQLKSHPYQDQFIIKDLDLEKVYAFTKLTGLSLCGSAVTDTGVIEFLNIFKQLKEIDLSNCFLITDTTVRKLSQEKMDKITLQGLNSISQQAVLSLILRSYNLNYLSVKNCRQIHYQHFYQKVAKEYASNQTNLKWLQITSDIGVDLHINKLSYLTHLTSTDTINDQELAVLLQSNKTHLNGIFFTCCQELNHQSLQLIAMNVPNLKRIKLSTFIKLNDKLLKSFLIKFPAIEYLNLENCYSLTNDTMKHLSQFSHNLKILDISWCRTITDQGIKMFCKQNDIVLQQITLSNLKYITNKAIKYIANNCPSLKSLIIQKNDQITDQGINQISEKIPELEELVVNYCENLTDGSLSLVATRLLNLRRLEIQWCQVSSKCIGLMAKNLKSLQVLNLNFCPSICDKQIKLFAKNISSKIKVLKLQSSDKVTEQAFTCLSQSLSTVKYLNLRQCCGVSDSVVTSICKNSQSQLDHIDLSWCPSISDKSLFSLSQYQHQLSFLNLSGCVEITDIGIEWISTTLKNLQYLNLSLCQKLTDKSVRMISQLKKLRRLFLCGLKRITDAAVGNLSALTGLQDLQLSGCLQLSNNSLFSILHHFPKLSSLNINQCKNIKSQFLGIMLDKVESLRRLQISALEIDDQFLGKLPKSMKKLNYINLSLCGKITDHALLTLVEGIPSLIKIDLQNTSINSITKQNIMQKLNSRNMYNIPLS